MPQKWQPPKGSRFPDTPKKEVEIKVPKGFQFPDNVKKQGKLYISTKPPEVFASYRLTNSLSAGTQIGAKTQQPKGDRFPTTPPRQGKSNIPTHPQEVFLISDSS